ncbi:AAA family ATPase [Vibrio lentus]|uniref:AAA family ATPase n=1 Tax=Vibrio lentus TaxID=136468 RepID=UPI00178D013D|nr:AAA family ATPase [Vibrio lentus]MDN3632571.1 AAA family ATPase [Vibrio lentus]
MGNTAPKHHEELKEFTGLLRVVRVDSKGAGLFRATCTLTDDIGEILDREGLYYLDSSYHLMGHFVEVGQVWLIERGVRWSSSLTTQNGYVRPAHTIEPSLVVMCRPSGKHLIWHFTNYQWYPGIGEKKAESLIDTLSDGSGYVPLYDALDNQQIDRLASAPLITEWDAEVLIEGWERYGSTDVLAWLEDKQIEPDLAWRFFSFHGKKTIEAIEADPYCLTSFNMQWREVDELAQFKFEIARNDERRLQAAVTEVLWGAFNDHGHTKVELPYFLDNMKRYVGDDLEKWVSAHTGMIDQSRGLVRGEYIHAFEPAVMEMMVANRIADLLNTNYQPPLSIDTILSVISEFEVQQGFRLTKEQKEAVSTSVSTPFSIITGGAGVGKTTVLKALYALYDAASFERVQLALAGRAAQRMSEATGEDATTIAGHLYHFDWGQVDDADLKRMVVVVDEASMVDIHTMYRLVDRIPPQVHLILIGDPYQLPPVGAGLVLHELVERPYLPVSRLSVVKRTTADSSIPLVAGDVRNGRVSNELGDNVEFHKVDLKQIANRAINEYMKDTESSQILCSTNAMVDCVNTTAQKRLNPNGVILPYIIEGKIYDSEVRLNDPVICTANLYRQEYDLRNGTMGRIIEVYNEPRTFEVKPSNKSKKTKLMTSYGRAWWDNDSDTGFETELPIEVIEKLHLAYGITVHKAQGSQFRHVIFVAVDGQSLDRTLVYTAITRASHHAVVMGDINAVNKAISRPPSAANRLVGLGQFLDEIVEEL